jgi:hypothetical protein
VLPSVIENDDDDNNNNNMFYFSDIPRPRQATAEVLRHCLI